MKKSLKWVLSSGLVLAAVVFAMRQQNAPDLEHKSSSFTDLAAAHRIPSQDVNPPGKDPEPPPSFLEMGDPRVTALIVRDISKSPEGAGWRWTFSKPAIKFPVAGIKDQRFAMDFSIVETVFRTTGPVTLSASINGHALGTFRCPHPGDFHFEAAVPDEWISGSDFALVEASLDKVWTSPSDGAKLGYILLRAGLRSSSK
jgi:hypothetical protein